MTLFIRCDYFRKNICFIDFIRYPNCWNVNYLGNIFLFLPCTGLQHCAAAGIHILKFYPVFGVARHPAAPALNKGAGRFEDCGRGRQSSRRLIRFPDFAGRVHINVLYLISTKKIHIDGTSLRVLWFRQVIIRDSSRRRRLEFIIAVRHSTNLIKRNYIHFYITMTTLS